MTAQTALARSRREGLLVALGLGFGGLLFALLALGGLIAVLEAVDPVYITLKVAGAAYILWIATKMWRGSSLPLAPVNAVPVQLAIIPVPARAGRSGE